MSYFENFEREELEREQEEALINASNERQKELDEAKEARTRLLNKLREDEMYRQAYYKHKKVEPTYSQAVFICSRLPGQALTDTGILIKASRGGGIILQYESKKGIKHTSCVYNPTHYVEELYRLTILAGSEHPERVKKPEPPKKTVEFKEVQ